MDPGASSARFGLQRRGVHGDEHVRLVARGDDVVIRDVHLERRHPGDRAGRGTDLGREVRHRRQVVAEHGADIGESVAGELHAVAGVTGEPDDDLVDALRYERCGLCCHASLTPLCGHPADDGVQLWVVRLLGSAGSADRAPAEKSPRALRSTPERAGVRLYRRPLVTTGCGVLGLSGIRDFAPSVTSGRRRRVTLTARRRPRARVARAANRGIDPAAVAGAPDELRFDVDARSHTTRTLEEPAPEPPDDHQPVAGVDGLQPCRRIPHGDRDRRGPVVARRAPQRQRGEPTARLEHADLRRPRARAAQHADVHRHLDGLARLHVRSRDSHDVPLLELLINSVIV